CLSIQNNVPQITDAVSALASFYRIGLSKGEDNIKLRDEISHAQMYLKILNIRFSDQIHTVWEIAPEIEDLHIIKMILQPIIENAAIHGIYERENGRGAIKIRGWQEEEHVYLTVEDDGVGMPQEVIAANFSPASQEISDMPGGYGIRNICDRIHIAYGAQYGLSCKSKMGVGSTVTIHIPRCP
ncbi:MAG: histidine kinase, partial [Roseburia sp.]|nr:histidine kinase [Roseburia sp.]